MRKEQGSIFIMTLIVLGVLVLFALSMAGLLRSDKALAQRAELQTVAESAANAGIDMAVYELKRNPNWVTGFSAVKLQQSGAVYSMSFNAGSGAPYSTNNMSGDAPVSGYGGRSVPPHTAYLVSIGSYAGVSFTEYAIVSVPANRFTRAIIGNNSIVFSNGAATDSYNSAQGTYAQTKQNTTGDIATNSAASGAIVLKTNSHVNDVVYVGPGGSGAVVSGNGSYESIVVNTAPLPVSPATAPGGTSQGSVTINGVQVLAPGVYDTITLKNTSTLILQKGTYVVKSILVSGHGTTSIVVNSGPANVYFTDTIDLNQSTQINIGGKPSNLTFWGTSTAEEFELGQSSQGYFLLYAPTATMDIGQSSHIYGSFVGDVFSVGNNVGIHYDRSLQLGAGGIATAAVVSRW